MKIPIPRIDLAGADSPTNVRYSRDEEVEIPHDSQESVLVPLIRDQNSEFFKQFSERQNERGPFNQTNRFFVNSNPSTSNQDEFPPLREDPIESPMTPSQSRNADCKYVVVRA